jgi:hypothetical protein
MTTLTQDLADLASRKDGEKAGDARTGGEHGQFVCIELGNLLDRHVRLAGQGLEAPSCAALWWGCVAEASRVMVLLS